MNRSSGNERVRVWKQIALTASGQPVDSMLVRRRWLHCLGPKPPFCASKNLKALPVPKLEARTHRGAEVDNELRHNGQLGQASLLEINCILSIALLSIILLPVLPARLWASHSEWPKHFFKSCPTKGA